MSTVMKRKRTNGKKGKETAAPTSKTGVLVGGKIKSKPLYTPAEVAEILEVSRATISNKMDSGAIKSETLFHGAEAKAPPLTSNGKKREQIRRIPYEELIRISPSVADRML